MNKRPYRPANIQEMFMEFVIITKTSKQVLEAPPDLRKGLYNMEIFLAWMIHFYEVSFWFMAEIALDRASTQEGSLSLQKEVKETCKFELDALNATCDEFAGSAVNILCTTIFIRSQVGIEKFAEDLHEPCVSNIFAEYQGFMLTSSKGYQFGSLINENSDCVKEYAEIVKRVIAIQNDMIPSLIVLERYFKKYAFFEGDDDIVVPTRKILLDKFRSRLN